MKILTGFAYLRNAAGTGFVFLLFGLGGLLLSLLVLPVLRLVPASQQEREKRTRKLMHKGFRLFFWILGSLKLIYHEIDGVERFAENEPCLIVANHPTLLDVVLLFSCLPDAICVIKKDAKANPFFYGVLRECGYIANDGGKDLVDQCVEKLNYGNTLLIFPEGTRSPSGSLGRFSRGAAHIALRSNCRILPVTITIDDPILEKNWKWYDVLPFATTMRLKALEPISLKKYRESGDEPCILARHLTKNLRNIFEERVLNVES